MGVPHSAISAKFLDNIAFILNCAVAMVVLATVTSAGMVQFNSVQVSPVPAAENKGCMVYPL